MKDGLRFSRFCFLHCNEVILPLIAINDLSMATKLCPETSRLWFRDQQSVSSFSWLLFSCWTWLFMTIFLSSESFFPSRCHLVFLLFFRPAETEDEDDDLTDLWFEYFLPASSSRIFLSPIPNLWVGRENCNREQFKKNGKYVRASWWNITLFHHLHLLSRPKWPAETPKSGFTPERQNGCFRFHYFPGSIELRIFLSDWSKRRGERKRESWMQSIQSQVMKRREFFSGFSGFLSESFSCTEFSQSLHPIHLHLSSFQESLDTLFLWFRPWNSRCRRLYSWMYQRSCSWPSKLIQTSLGITMAAFLQFFLHLTPDRFDSSLFSPISSRWWVISWRP